VRTVATDDRVESCRGNIVSTRYLLVADPLESLNPVFDLGVCLATELLGRGLAVDYLDLLAMDPEQATDTYLESLQVREILSSSAAASPFWRLGPGRQAAVDEYRVLLQRKDPPVDEVYVNHHRHFIEAPRHILQINRPPATYELSEHTLALRYPEFAAPTEVCTSLEQLISAVRGVDGEVVLKPLNTYCGIGIEFVQPTVDRAFLASFWDRWQPEVIVQPFLPEIEHTGDLRILTIGQTVLGSVLRVPAGGSRLANLHQGARAAALAPSPRQLEACRVVADDLSPQGLHLLGLDFIGEHLTEINFTSPTTIVQINQVNDIRADVMLVDELERMWRELARG
jgi:glutathione synthase